MTDYTLFVYANEKLRRIYFNHVYIIYGCYISIIFNTKEKMLLADGVSFSLYYYFETTFIMLKYFALLHLLALKNIQIVSLSDFNAVENVS